MEQFVRGLLLVMDEVELDEDDDDEVEAFDDEERLRCLALIGGDGADDDTAIFSINPFGSLLLRALLPAFVSAFMVDSFIIILAGKKNSTKNKKNPNNNK